VNRLLRLAREDGWAQVIPRAVGSGVRRIRDSLTARKLHAPGFRVGRGPRLSGLAHMKIGKRFSAGDHVWIEAVVQYGGKLHSPELVIGENVNLSANVHIACLNRIEIGDGFLSGSHVLISDHTHGHYASGSVGEQSHPSTRPTERSLHSAGEIIMGKNVWLGDGVCVLAGAHIGDGAIIGANSVVRGIIPPYTIAVGAPARVIRRWDEERRAWI
jgi:acetyltransferase-like isoleucine patch superfamily enzyme